MRDGRPASRLRVLWRGLISWAPVLLAPFGVGFLSPALGLTWAIVLLLALLSVFALWSVLVPDRSLQDRLAHTVLVMR